MYWTWYWPKQQARTRILRTQLSQPIQCIVIGTDAMEVVCEIKIPQKQHCIIIVCSRELLLGLHKVSLGQWLRPWPISSFPTAWWQGWQDFCSERSRSLGEKRKKEYIPKLLVGGGGTSLSQWLRPWLTSSFLTALTRWRGKVPLLTTCHRHLPGPANTVMPSSTKSTPSLHCGVDWTFYIGVDFSSCVWRQQFAGRPKAGCRLRLLMQQQDRGTLTIYQTRPQRNF